MVLCTPEEIKELHKLRKVHKIKMNLRINSHFKGSEFHHLHIKAAPCVGVFIPKKIHKSVWHDGATGRGIREINRLALLWLCEQSII